MKISRPYATLKTLAPLLFFLGGPQAVTAAALPPELVGEASANGRSALHAAAEQGLEAWAKALLDAGAPVTRLDAEGLSPVHLAARSGQGRVLALLLARHPEALDLPSKQGRTPLYSAIQSHQTAIALQLLLAGAQPLRPDQAGISPLLAALMADDHAVLNAMTARGIELRAALAEPLADGRSSLHLLAALPNQQAHLQQVLAQGLDANQDLHKPAAGGTPLELALRAQQVGNAWILLRAGGLSDEPEQGRQAWLALRPLLNGPNLGGQGPAPELAALLRAFLAGRNWLTEPDAGGQSLLSQRLQERDTAALAYLLPLAGADGRDADGRTLLMQAVSLKPAYGEGVSLLLNAGARVRDIDAAGNTALHLAVLAGQNELVDLLLPRYGALPVNRKGKTPLDLARDARNGELVERLRRLYIKQLFE